MNELTINLNSHAKEPLYEQIYEYIKEEIRNNRISFNTKLPSTRALALHLQVSRSTVDMAYSQLLSEGYIEAIPYKGYYACQIDELYSLDRKELAVSELFPEEKEKYQYNYSYTGIDLTSFPYNTWRKITKSTLNDDNKELFQIGSRKGDLAFRESIRKYLYQSRGVVCNTEQIIIGAGNDYMIILLSLILGKDHLIAMENPTYKPAFRSFSGLGYKVLPIPLDKNGMDVKILEKTEASIAYVMPSHQFPLGTVMPVRRRMELLNWAKGRQKRYIIEDDYDSEFRYKGKPIPALQGYDRDGKVIYMGTFSKAIAPAIRMNYMVLPPSLLEVYDKKCSFCTSTVSRIDQTIVNTFITEGYFERHLNRMRAIYRSKHDILLNELRWLGEDFEISGEYAGLHILVKAKNGLTEAELIQRAKEKGIRVYGLSEHYISGSEDSENNTVLIGYANMTEKKIKESLPLLAEAWNRK
jgi:DNA-binding transcriptional MocR family regulator